MYKEPERLVQHGFRNVEIEKAKLLDIIKENKNKHVKEYGEAVKAFNAAKLTYAQEFWAQLSENIGLAKKAMEEKLEIVAGAVLDAREEARGENPEIDLSKINASVQFNLNPKVQLTAKKPVSHEKDYDIAIRAMELSTAEFVYLEMGDFMKYVQDEWEWKNEFNSNNLTLINGISVANNSYFSNSNYTISGSYFPIYSGCITTVASGISSLGEKSTELYSSIMNSTEEN